MLIEFSRCLKRYTNGDIFLKDPNTYLNINFKLLHLNFFGILLNSFFVFFIVIFFLSMKLLPSFLFFPTAVAVAE